jgi:GrpB-like predicted nucleotidyltransferase (UPF0157 family)
MSDNDIYIVDYDPRWPERFAEEAERIRRLISDPSIEIEHHGSTAVPGFAAKPVIDLLVAAPSIEIAETYADVLVDNDYEHVDPRYREFWPERIVLIRREHGTRTCHVHLMLRHHHNWTRLLAFRDYLRAHPGVAAEYSTLKRLLAAAHGADRHAYMMAKTDFIAPIIGRALQIVPYASSCGLARP